MPAKAAKQTDQLIRLRVICQRPLDAKRYGAEFGLQDNSTTADWVLHAGQPQPNGDIRFDCECRVRRHPQSVTPNFLGPFVHGPVTERFLYLSWRPWGWKPGQPEPACPAWVRRIKVHLRTITWAQIAKAAKRYGCLQTRVDGIGRDGGPACASVPLIGGWTEAAS